MKGESIGWLTEKNENSFITGEFNILGVLTEQMPHIAQQPTLRGFIHIPGGDRIGLAGWVYYRDNGLGIRFESDEPQKNTHALPENVINEKIQNPDLLGYINISSKEIKIYGRVEYPGDGTMVVKIGSI